VRLASPVVPLVDEWARRGAPSGDDDRIAFRRFVAAAAGDGGAGLSPAGRAALVALAGSLRSVGQGLAVGGRRASTVRINDNIVREAVQGVHVGLSRPGIGARDSIDEVLVSRNAIHLVVPATYARDRHAVFVGSAAAVEVVDTRATVVRTAGGPGIVPTPVDGVRIVGILGPFVVVRSASFAGFATGVRVEPRGTTPTQRVWSIAELNAAGLTGAVGAAAPVTFTRTLVAPP
jgi:hypothetical protein